MMEQPQENTLSNMVSISLHEFMQEVMTWHTFTDEQLLKARDSGITNDNNKKLQKLVSAWMLGDYDEDLSQLISEIENLIP